MSSGSLAKRAAFLLVSRRLRKTQAGILLVGLAVNPGSDGKRGWVVERSSISTERWMLPQLLRFLLKNTDKYGRPPPWYVFSHVCLAWNLVKWTVLQRDMAFFFLPQTFPVRIPLALVRLLMHINRWAGSAWTLWDTWALKHAIALVYGPRDAGAESKGVHSMLRATLTNFCSVFDSMDLWITPWSCWFCGITARKFGKTSSEFWT